jgi:N-acetylglucosamine kinase-like BadF-type ATPase
MLRSIILMLFIGVDGGGTNTAAVASDETGRIVACAVSEATNYHNVGVEQALDVLEKLVTNLISASGAERADAVFYGLAGIDSQRDYEIMHKALLKVPKVKEFTLKNDTETLYYTVTFGRPGIVVIAGTGSNVYGRNSQDKSWKAGDHGHILGDQGSAYHIAVEALRAAMKSYDGRGPKTALEKRFCELYQVADLGELAGLFYSLRQDVSEIASLARYVSDLAHQGDEVSKTILRNAASELAKGVRAVAGKLGMEEEPIIVGGGGGVLKNQEHVWKPFVDDVKQSLPKARIKPPLTYFTQSLGGIIYYLTEKLGFEITDAKFEEMMRQVDKQLGASPA